MRSRSLAAVVLIAGALVLAGCDALPSDTPSPTASESSPGPTPSGSSTVAPSPTAEAGFTLPDSCDALYSPAMLEELNSTNPPLNDPGITIYATENVAALEILTSGVPTLRCSWGAAGSPGLVTNVSIVSSDQSSTLLDAFTSSGMACETLGAGTVCRIEQQTIDRNDNIVTIGEAHYLQGDGWVATHWVGFSPDGYTEDIVATLWP
ncbi:hypothetical protein [Microbacterium schleiferi]|uniref:DUF3558 domain-containing protein n=1 Tax=Microbacterium schleiferi TaxID=69362 RepID=A0ABU7V1Y4_9MICO|nr:hypothetical protein [Micrococcales bacterium]